MTVEPRQSTMTQAPRAERKALPRELADFLIEFSIALHKHAMYPGGHPTLAPAAEGVAHRLESLLLDRGSLSLGVARDQLVIEGVATDPRNPVLKDLASRLHRHHLGAVSFARGVTWTELEGALKALAQEADRGGDALGLRPKEQIPSWPHLHLFPLTFDKLELVGGPEEAEGTDVSKGRSALLWVGLARAAMAAEGVQPDAKFPEPQALRPEGQAAPPLSESEIDAALSEVQVGDMEHAPAEPAAVAKAIEAHERGTAYDQVIVGYLLQIAQELKTTGGAGAIALKKKMSRLVTELDDQTLQRLISMGGNAGQRRQFLADATQGMAVEAVVELVKAASGTGAPISNAMLRMLQKLGRHAERGPAPRRALADTELREQVMELIKGWELADPNPDGYALALQRMTRAEPTMVTAVETAYAPETERLVQMALEAGGTGPGLERPVEEMVSSGRVSELLALVSRAPRLNPAVERVRGRVLEPGMLKSALMSQPVNFELVDRLIESQGEVAIEPLLDALAESESRQVRRAITDRLLKMGEAVGPALARRLEDERWHVLRNILYLAAEMPGRPPVDAAALSRHADVRVRREAMRVQFRQERDTRNRAICAALADEDERTRRSALTAVLQGGCPDPAVPLIIALATDDEQDDDLRIFAVRALGAKGGGLALEALLRLTEVKRRSIMQVMISSGSQYGALHLAALSALGAFKNDHRARRRLEAAVDSRDPAAQRIASKALEND